MTATEKSETLSHDKFTKFLQMHPNSIAIAPPEFLNAIAGEEVFIPDSVRWFGHIINVDPQGYEGILDLTKRKRLLPGTYTMSNPFFIVSVVIIYDPDSPHKKIVTAPYNEPYFMRIEQNSLIYKLFIPNPTESPFYISPDRYRQIEKEVHQMWDQ